MPFNYRIFQCPVFNAQTFVLNSMYNRLNVIYNVGALEPLIMAPSKNGVSTVIEEH